MAPANGMDNIPDNVLRAFARRMSDEGDISEPEIAKKLTDECWEELLTNALLIYHLLD